MDTYRPQCPLGVDCSQICVSKDCGINAIICKQHQDCQKHHNQCKSNLSWYRFYLNTINKVLVPNQQAIEYIHAVRQMYINMLNQIHDCYQQFQSNTWKIGLIPEHISIIRKLKSKVNVFTGTELAGLIESIEHRAKVRNDLQKAAIAFKNLKTELDGLNIIHDHEQAVQKQKKQQKEVAKQQKVFNNQEIQHFLETQGIKQTKKKEQGYAKNDGEIVRMQIHEKQIDGGWAKMIGSLAQMQELILERVIINKEHIQQFKKLTNLSTLTMKKCKLTQEHLSFLPQLCKLKKLNLCDNQLTIKSINYITELKQLTELELDDTQINDDGVKTLKALTNLTKLSLFSNNLTIDSLQHLKEFKQLKQLSIGDNNLAPEEQQAIQRSFPDIQINY